MSTSFDKSGPERIRVSARWLMEILSGKFPIDQAMKQYQIPPEIARRPQQNPFSLALNAGKLPRSIRLVHDDSADDDEIEFVFGDVDAAIAKFAVPKR